MTSFIIIGAGNFGASTALALAQRGHDNVTIIDTAPFPNPRAASHDINKIVRDDYPDLLYMRMMSKAMSKWRKDPLYSRFYHEVGLLRVDASDFGKESMASYRELGIGNSCQLLPVEDVRRRWNEALATADFHGVSHVLFNPAAGFVEAARALGAVIEEAISQGVRYMAEGVKKLDFGLDGRCIGITLNTGRQLQADKILLATGARTAALLAQSAPEKIKMHAGDRAVACGALSFFGKLHGEQRERFAGIPILKNCLPQVKGEGMSMLPDGTIKFNCDMCFTNYVTWPATGERISMAPDQKVFNQWTGPKFISILQERARRTMNGLYGKEVEGISIDEYRICWDASTPTHDFLITPHPHSQGLYVATGGSFHGWKFLPVLGEYIANMMQGILEAEYADRWAWDKTLRDGQSANPTYRVVGDLQDWMA